MKCSRCKREPATSIATGLCAACLYADAMGREAAERQRELAEAERARARLAAQMGRGK